MRLSKWIVFILVLAAFTAHAGAGHTEAVDTADKLSKAINSVDLPYQVKSGNYTITIKSASYDEKTGILSTHINAMLDGKSLAIRNPVRWYIPIAVSGTNNSQKLSAYVQMIKSYLATVQPGNPENDDTLIIYPTDGLRTYRSGVDETFLAIISNAATGTDNYARPVLSSSSTTNKFSTLGRLFLSFNTSAVPDDATIIAVGITTTYSDRYNSFAGYADYGWTFAHPSDPENIAQGDHGNVYNTLIAPTINYLQWDGIENFDIYTSELAGINKNGYTSMSFRIYDDIAATFYETWAVSKSAYITMHPYNDADESTRPFLTIIYIPASTPTPTPTPTPTTPTPTATPTPTPTGTPPVQAPAQPGRISPLGFVLLATIDFGLFFYALVDNENRNYFHIIACIAAVIVSFLCGTFLITGYITEDFVVTNIEASVNESVLSTYSVHQAQIIDAGFGYFFMFVGVVMLLIGVLASIEAFREFSSGAGGDFE